VLDKKIKTLPFHEKSVIL